MNIRLLIILGLFIANLHAMENENKNWREQAEKYMLHFNQKISMQERCYNKRAQMVAASLKELDKALAIVEHGHSDAALVRWAQVTIEESQGLIKIAQKTEQGLGELEKWHTLSAKIDELNKQGDKAVKAFKDSMQSYANFLKLEQEANEALHPANLTYMYALIFTAGYMSATLLSNLTN